VGGRRWPKQCINVTVKMIKEKKVKGRENKK
jgi:hypothetical protein